MELLLYLTLSSHSFLLQSRCSLAERRITHTQSPSKKVRVSAFQALVCEVQGKWLRTFTAASMQPKGTHTPAGVLNPDLVAAVASCAHAAAFAPQFAGVAFSSSTTDAFPT